MYTCIYICYRGNLYSKSMEERSLLEKYYHGLSLQVFGSCSISISFHAPNQAPIKSLDSIELRRGQIMK